MVQLRGFSLFMVPVCGVIMTQSHYWNAHTVLTFDIPGQPSLEGDSPRL